MAKYQQPPVYEKKSLNDALYNLARNKNPQYALLSYVQYARLINQTCGGVVIAPWQVEELSEEWLNIFIGLSDLPNLKNEAQAFENRLRERRKANPHYRKYLN